MPQGFVVVAVIAYVARDAHDPGDGRTFAHALVGHLLMGILAVAIAGAKPIQGTVFGRLIMAYLVLIPVSAIAFQVIGPELSLRDLAIQSLLIPAFIAPLAFACFAVFDRLFPQGDGDDTRS